MKKKLISVLSLFIIVLALFGFSSTHKQPLIKQSYTVIETHDDHVTAVSKQYPNEYLDFYYDDMQRKQNVNVNNNITVYFSVDSKGNYHLEDWKNNMN